MGVSENSIADACSDLAEEVSSWRVIRASSLCVCACAHTHLLAQSFPTVWHALFSELFIYLFIHLFKRQSERK